MSAHVPLDALEPTLTDVLAFLDAFESDATASTAGSSDDGRRSPPSAAERRKTRKAAASRRCQQKKRAELLALRAQVAALETRVGELKQARKTHATSGLNLDKTQPLQVSQMWRDRARLEQQLRQQSEQRNQQLQLVVARQSQVARAVRSVLDNVTSVVHFEEALRTPPPTSVLGEFVPNLNDAIYNELATRLGRIYVDTNSMFSSLDEIVVKDVSTGVQVRRDAVTGLPYVELTAAMKTSLEMNQAEKVLMNMSTCHYKKYRKYLTEQGIKKETELELREEELAVALSTMSLSRKYEEDNRLILTFSSLVCDHPTKSAMRFHEEGFIVLSQSPMSPQSGAVIQSRYRLTPDMDSWVSATQNTETVKMFVLKKLGSMMWSNIQRIQANCIEAQSNPASIPAF